MRNTEFEIKQLLSGVIPERVIEITEYFNKYSPSVTRMSDRKGFNMGTAFTIIQFTQRTMLQLWLLGYAGTQAEYCFADIIAKNWYIKNKLDTNDVCNDHILQFDEEIYNSIIDNVRKLDEVEDLDDFDWPQNIPDPDAGKPTDIINAATFDLICMSGGFVFLHEMKHLEYSENGDSPDNQHLEEIACDSFAKSMMLDKIEQYSITSGYDPNLVYIKRSISIFLALFCILVTTPTNSWAATETHPSIKRRFDSFLDGLSINDNEKAWIYMSSLLLAHLRHIDQNRLIIEFKSFKELFLKLIEEMDIISQKHKKNES